MVKHAVIAAMWKVLVEGSLLGGKTQTKIARPYPKNKLEKDWGPFLVDTCKCKTLGSNPSTIKKQKGSVSGFYLLYASGIALSHL
jgi:hypothetical protein